MAEMPVHSSEWKCGAPHYEDEDIVNSLGKLRAVV